MVELIVVKIAVCEASVCQFTFRSLTVEPSNFIDEICEERSELGSFEAYTANQLKEELEFQKGRGQRERAFKSRSELAEAIDNRVSLTDDQIDRLTAPREDSLLPGSSRVIIHGSGIGTVYHRNKFPGLYEDGRGGGRYTVTRAIYEKEVEKWRLGSLRKVIN